MRSSLYLNAVLTAIAACLLAVLLTLGGGRGDHSVQLVPELFAQAELSSGPVSFYPVGNQQIRRFVFFDHAAGTVYDYDSDGDLDRTWRMTTLGDRLERLD